jgi:hypothetical protein
MPDPVIVPVTERGNASATDDTPTVIKINPERNRSIRVAKNIKFFIFIIISFSKVYCPLAAGGHTRSYPMRRRNSLRQPLPPTDLAHPLASRLSHHRCRGSATDKVLEKRTFLWIMGDKRPVEPTQSRNGAEAQGF